MKNKTPLIIWMYRLISMGVIILVYRFAFLHDEYLPIAKTITRFGVFPITIAMFVVSWLQRRIATRIMASYVIIIPLITAMMLRLLVLRNSPLWDFAVSLCVIMALPILFARLLMHQPEVLSYYSAQQHIPSRSESDNNN